MSLGTANSMRPPTPASTAARAALRSESRVCWRTPGIDATGTGSVIPSRTNIGRTRSAGDTRVSATIRRSGAVRRSRLGRTTGPGLVGDGWIELLIRVLRRDVVGVGRG